jgi:hypothetical protein
MQDKVTDETIKAWSKKIHKVCEDILAPYGYKTELVNLEPCSVSNLALLTEARIKKTAMELLTVQKKFLVKVATHLEEKGIDKEEINKIFLP